MIYNIDLNIKLELKGLSQKELLKICDELAIDTAEFKKIDFEIIDKMFAISPRNYYLSQISNIEIDRELTPKTVNIEIVG